MPNVIDKRRDPRGLKDWRGTKRANPSPCRCWYCLGRPRQRSWSRRAALDAREQMGEER